VEPTNTIREVHEKIYDAVYERFLKKDSTTTRKSIEIPLYGDDLSQSIWAGQKLCHLGSPRGYDIEKTVEECEIKEENTLRLSIRYTMDTAEERKKLLEEAMKTKKAQEEAWKAKQRKLSEEWKEAHEERKKKAREEKLKAAAAKKKVRRGKARSNMWTRRARNASKASKP